MGGGLLHIAQRHPGVERGGDERVPERVRPDSFANPGPTRHPAVHPPGAVPVQPPPVTGDEDRPVAAFPGGQVDRPGGAGCERDGDDLATRQDRPARPGPPKGDPQFKPERRCRSPICKRRFHVLNSADLDVCEQADRRTSQTQIARFGVTSSGHPAGQVADHIGGYACASPRRLDHAS